MEPTSLFPAEVSVGDVEASSTDGNGVVRSTVTGDSGVPLPARMRPRRLEDVVGQDAVLGAHTPLRRLIEGGRPPSLLLWGPPGVGKTSLATVIAGCVDAVFIELSAVTAGVKDVRRIIDEGRSRLQLRERRTVLFVDEIHRFNTAQQDALLPGVEAGWVTLIGATTQNPYFEVTAPLLSRCQLVRLEPLDADAVRLLLHRALQAPDGLGDRFVVDDEALDYLVAIADGDARAALGALEAAAAAVGLDESGEGGVRAGSGDNDDQGDAQRIPIGLEAVQLAQRRFRYDKFADGHYDQVSAFIKSVRGSDPDASVYWLLRMLESGEDPRFVARRLIILASEDVGLADRLALPIAVAAAEALDRVGLPEARYALVHATLALATAPKSNSVALALSKGLAAVRDAGNADVPAHLRDGHYRGAADLGHGVGYQYPHDHPHGFVAEQQYLPDVLEGTQLYRPTEYGHERHVAERVAALRRTTSQVRSERPDSRNRQRKEDQL